MIKAKSYKDNWVLYFWLGIVLRSVLAFSGSFLFLLFVFLKGAKAGSSILEYFIEHSFLYLLVCFIPVLILIGMIFSRKNKWRIVGFEFCDQEIILLVRKNKLATLKKVILNKTKLTGSTQIEKGLFFLGGNRFFVIKNSIDNQSYWFNYDHYIWEKQIRDKVFFKKNMKHYFNVLIPKKPKELEPKDFISHY